MQDEIYTQKYTATDINYWFGDHKTYREGRDMYWAIMSKYEWSPSRVDCPPITLTEYAYWYPFHMLMQEKFCPLVAHEKD